MARIIPELAARATAARARWAWNRRVRHVRLGDLATIEYRADDWQWWSTGVTTRIGSDVTLAGIHLTPFSAGDWPAEGRYILHGDDVFPMWDTRGLPRPQETLPRLHNAESLYEVQVWWNGDNGHGGRTDHCVRGLLLDADPVYGEVFIGSDADTGTEVPLDLILYATVTGEIPAEVIS